MKKKSVSTLAFVTPRHLIGVALALGALFLTVAGFAQTRFTAQWPSLQQQLTQEYRGFRIGTGTALEQLVRDNQEFYLLRDDEKADSRGLPPWLRVWFRKQHPDDTYSADDPTGGYPRALNEILEWMLTHQDLKAGPGIDAQAAKARDEEEDPDAVIGSNLRISGAQTVARSESDIRINYFDPTKVISASNNIGGNGKQAIYYSTNSGATWGQTTLPGTGSDSSHSDPTVDWTSDGRAWSATLGIAGGSLRFRNYFSIDSGATWTFEGTASGTQTNVDKEMLWADHSATSPFQNQIYGIWHNGNPAYMNRRTAGAGGTWLTTPVQVSGAESTGTCIGGAVITNSAGDVFGAWPTTTNSKIFIVKSTNGGTSYGLPVQVATTYDSYDIGIPSFNSRRALIYVSIGAYKTVLKNNVYVLWTDLSGDAGCTAPANEPGSSVASTCKMRVWFSRSTDGGATWSAPIKTNNQASLNDQFNQWMAVDETTGGIGIMYYDTVGDAGRKKTDVWYQSSADDGVTWSAAQKVSTSMTDETISGADSGNQYGDYNSISAYSNVLFPSWTDRRNAAREEIWTVPITETFATPTPGATGTPTPVPTVSPTPTPAPTATPTSTPSPSPSPSPTRTPTPTPTPAPSPTPTPAPTPTPTPAPTPTPSPTPAPTPTPSPAPTATPTPAPTASPTPDLALDVFLPVVTIDTSTTNFNQPVTVSNIDASDNLIGFQGDFTFDQTIVTFQISPVSAAGLTSNNWNVSANVLPGGGPTKTLRISAFSTDGFTPLSGTGTLLMLNLTRVSSTAGANTPLIWQAPPNDVEFFNTNLDIRTPNNTPTGSITIQVSTPTPTPAVVNIAGSITYCSNPSLNPVPGVTMTLSGGASATTATDGSGNYSFGSLASGGNYTITPTKTPLASGSAGINTVDVLGVQRHFLGITIIPPGCRLVAADVNGDSNVTTIDVVAVQRFFLGFTTGIANVGKYSFAPTNRVYTGISSDQTAQNYDSLVFGDVASGFVHRPEGASQDLESDGAAEVPPTVTAVSLPGVKLGQAQGAKSATVTTTSIDRTNKLVGFQGDIIFDERAISFASIPVRKAGLTAGNWNVSGNILDGPGPIRTLRISAYSTDFTPLSGKGTLFEVNVTRQSEKMDPLLWAASPNDFLFIDADLNTQRPISSASGRVVTESMRR